jgi:hypothetical protein
VIHGDLSDGFKAEFHFWDVIACHARLIHKPYKELEDIFEFVRRYDIPAREPGGFDLLMRLGKAGVRIVDGE